MKKVKSILILLIILVILILITMMTILLLNTDKIRQKDGTIHNGTKNNIVFDDDNQPDAPEERETAENITRLNHSNTFFSIEKCIHRYFVYLRAGNSKAVAEIIEESYKNAKGINEKNALNVLRGDIPYDGKYVVKEIYVREDNYKPIYFIVGTLEKNSVKTPYYLMMKQDKENIAFSLKPITEQEYNRYIRGTEEEAFIEEIELGEYNKIINITLTKEELAGKYLDSYVQNARYDSQEAYNSLDEEYRRARFGSYQNYVAYLTEPNKAKQLASLDHNSIKEQSEFSSDEEYAEYINSLSQATFKKYDTYSEEGKEYYIVLDDYDNFYVFEIESVMNYKLYLDSYTVDIDYFMKQYLEDTTVEEKTQINIEKIFEALNNKDYHYVYDKIDEEVRTETFRNYETFADYMQRGLFNSNQVEYDDNREEGNRCTYQIIVTDKEGKNTTKIPMTISIELDESQNTYKIMKILFE